MNGLNRSRSSTIAWLLTGVALVPACVPEDVAGIIHDGAAGTSAASVSGINPQRTAATGTTSTGNAGASAQGASSAKSRPIGGSGGDSVVDDRSAVGLGGAATPGTGSGAASVGGTHSGITSAATGAGGTSSVVALGGAAVAGTSASATPLPVLKWKSARDVGPSDATGDLSCHSLSAAITSSDQVFVSYAMMKVTSASDSEGVWGLRYDAAVGSLDTPARLSRPGTGLNALVAASDQGDAVVAWNTLDVPPELVVRRFAATRGWPDGWVPSEAIGPTTGAGDAPLLSGLAMSPRGHAAVAWGMYNSSGAFLRIYEAGTGWEVTRSIPEVLASRVGVAALEVPRGLDFVVVATQGEIAALPYHYDLTTHAGEFGASTKLFTASNGLNVRGEEFGLDGSGNLFVGVSQADWPQVTETNDTFVSRYTGTGAPVIVAAMNDTPGATGPALAVNRKGHSVALVRQCNPPTLCSLFARRFVEGNWQQAEAIAAPGNGPDDGAFAVAINDQDRAVAVWARGESSQGTVWASEFDPATGWGTPHLIDRAGRSATNYLEVVLGPTGNGLAVWANAELGLIDPTFVRHTIRFAAFATN